MLTRKFISIIFFYFLVLGNSYSIEADVFVQSTVNRASKILSENLSKKEKKLYQKLETLSRNFVFKHTRKKPLTNISIVHI